MKDRIVIDFSALDRIASKLDAAGDELASAMSVLSGAHPTGESGGDMRIDGSLSLRSVPVRISAANAYQTVQGCRDALGRVSGYSRTLAARVRNASGRFDSAEGTLAGDARGKSTGEDAPAADGTSSGGVSFGWSDLWEAVSEFGIVGGTVGAFGELITGWTGDVPKSLMKFLKSASKVGGQIASGVSEMDSQTGFDWRRLVGLNTETAPKSWSEALGEELSKYSFKNAEKVSGKIAVACKWAGTALTVGTTAWDNWHEEGNSTGRKLAETVIESGVKLGTSFAVGTGVALGLAALGVAGPPAVLVGGLTLAVTMGLDKFCEWANDGHDLAETASDLILDWIPDALDKTADFVADTAEHVTEYVSRAGEKVGNAISNAGRTISGWWDRLTGQTAAAGAW